MQHHTRDEIIQAVIKLYSSYSYEEISISMIMEAMPISRGSLYWHFSSKEEIFTAVFERCYEKAVAASRVGLDDETTALGCLKRRLKGLIELNRIDPFCLIVNVKHLTRMRRDTGLYGPYGAFAEDIERIIQKGMDAGEFVDLPKHFLIMTAHGINSHMNDYLRHYPDTYNNPVLIEHMVDCLFHAITKREDG